jgi:hypothetical protein
MTEKQLLAFDSLTQETLDSHKKHIISRFGIDCRVKAERRSDHIAPIAQEILDVYWNMGFDEAYIQDKRTALIEMDKLAVLQFCYYLDAKCKIALTDKLGVKLDDFNTTLETLTKIN